ncbi:MAG: TolC family protein [Bacteroidales bacterium]|nr:TolC family protein [Bacteroidales bacterium]
MRQDMRSRPTKTFLVACALAISVTAGAQTYSLEQCRQMAIANNKEMRIKNAKVEQAGYQKKEAFAAYLPSIDFSGGYLYNQKEISVFGSDQYLPVKNFNAKTGTYDFGIVTNPETGLPVKTASGEYVFEQVAYLPKESLTYDIHNVFFGAITLTQPIYMGGKIVAMNKMTGYAEDLAKQLRDAEAENIIYAVDAAYWQVVSLHAKKLLAESYVALLDTLDRNVGLMVEQGVATGSDKLSVDVKLNQANVDLVKVDNGLVLSRMALCQLCGLPVDTPIQVEDESVDHPSPTLQQYSINMNDVYDRRHDVKALELGVKIYDQKARVAESDMLPKLALVGMYSFSNPNMFNGFEKKFSGAFSVGAMLTVPIWHWGGNYNKYRAAKVDRQVQELELEDAKEKIDLQVNQAAFRAQEAVKTYDMTVTNLTKANENLRQATLGFREGVMTTDNVMEAQTAWLKANSEKIDAEIDVHLCDTYLSKVLGLLNY